jgi:general secretion pathway protein G
MHRKGIRHPQGNRGFTLIELLVVMTILGLLIAIVGPNIWNKLSKGKQTAAKTQVETFGQALDSFRLDVGRYPTTTEGLNALITDPGVDKWDGPYLKKGIVPNDPWNRPYQYQSPGAHGDYDLFSYGLDGTQGGDGENKDVNSWE